MGWGVAFGHSQRMTAVAPQDEDPVIVQCPVAHHAPIARRREAMHRLGVEVIAAIIAVLVVPRAPVVSPAQRQAGPAQDPIVAYVKPDKVHRGLGPAPLTIRRLAIQPAEQPKAGARLTRRIAGKHVDYPAQSPRAVQSRASPFDYLHALDLLQGHGIPLDVAQIRRQHRKSIHQHQ